MKRMRVVLLALLTVCLSALLFSCAGAPEGVEAESEVAAKKTVKKEQSKYKEVREKIQLVEKKSFYYPDGVLDRYRIFTYPEGKLTLLKENLFNSEDELQERISYEYNEGVCSSKSSFDAEGKPVSVHRYAYDGDGNLIEDTLYDGDEEVQSISKYEYDDAGRKTKWSIHEGGGALLAYTVYSYENGLNTKIENFSPGGELDDYFIIEYGNNGQKKKETWYKGSGEIEEYRLYSYEEGALTEETVHRKNNSVKLKIRFRNNEMGNPEKTVYMDGGDTVREQVAFEYIERTRMRKVQVE
jgi:YD repeat-containing protein